MNATDITAITALVVAVGGVVTTIWHIINHQAPKS